MTLNAPDVLEYVRSQDIKFIKMSFCDLLGRQKNLSIPAGALSRAFEHGVAFDAASISGFCGVEASDLYLRPDPSTLAVLPWRPQQGRVARLYCYIDTPTGEHFEGDARYLLRQAERRLSNMGYRLQIGTECEFYLFLADDNGQPTDIPHDRAGYCDAAPLDRGENLRREVCLTLEEMGIVPERSHHKQGPGQHEIVFACDAPLNAADHLLTFQSTVQSIAARNGLWANFAPKPMPAHNGNGMHVNFSLWRDSSNLCAEPMQEPVQQFLAGILEHGRALTAFFNRLPASYERLGQFEAPCDIGWSRQNRAQWIRVPAARTHSDARFELRAPDPAMPTHLGFALLLEAGMDGLRRGLRLPPSSEAAEAGIALPRTLEEALDCALESPFIRRVLPETLLVHYVDACRKAPCEAS